MLKIIHPKVYAIQRVYPYTFALWWPWLKNYSGERFVGYITRHFYSWVWIDEELKKSMGY